MYTQDDIMTYQNFNEIENKIEDLTSRVRNTIIGEYPDFSENERYNVGDVVVYNNNLYKCVRKVTVPGAWTGIYNGGYKNIEVGDDLIYRHLKFDWPATFWYESSLIDGFIKNDSNNFITYAATGTGGYVWMKNAGVSQILVEYDSSHNIKSGYLTEYDLGNFGIVSRVNTDFELYNCVKADIPVGNWEEYPIIPTYTPKTWAKKDFLLYTYLNNIEEGIFNLGKYYFRPYGWKKTKSWNKGMSFSYVDVNRWWIDLNLIEERLDNESSQLFPMDTLYPGETLLPH